jgi:hypothetical protein
MKYPILLAVCSGCAGTETGNAFDEPVPISIALRPAGLKLAAVDAQGLAVEVTSAVGQVQRIDFDLPAGRTCAQLGDRVEGGVCVAEGLGEYFRFTGPWTLDVLGNEMPIDGLAMPAGAYARVAVRMQRAEDSAEVDDDDLKQAVDMSLIIRGTAGAGSFTLHIRDTLDARFEGQAALVAGSGLVPVLLELPVATWFAGVDLGACVGSGNVLITDDSDDACEAVYEGVTRAIERVGRLDDDDDDDDD